MNTITPIIIPTSHPSPPPKCPSCGKDENTKLVCRHCGYEYTDDSLRWYHTLIIIGIIILGISFLILLVFSIFQWIDGKPLFRAILDNIITASGMFKNLW